MRKSQAHFMHINITNICHLIRIDFYWGTSWLQRHSSLLIGFPEQRSMHLAIAGKQRQIKTRSRNKTALEWRNGRLLAEAVSSVRSGFPLWPPLPALPSAALAADLVKRLSRQLYIHTYHLKRIETCFRPFSIQAMPTCGLFPDTELWRTEGPTLKHNLLNWTYRGLFLGKLGKTSIEKKRFLSGIARIT